MGVAAASGVICLPDSRPDRGKVSVDMTTCENGHAVPGGQPYCGECGAEILVACPAGHHTSALNHFCTVCGSPLSPAPIDATGDDAVDGDAAHYHGDHAPVVAAPPKDGRLSDAPQPDAERTRWLRSPALAIVGLVGVAAVGALMAMLASRNGSGGSSSSGGGGGTQIELARQFLLDRCDLPDDASLTHLGTLPGDNGLTEISFTTSEDFVGTVYVDANSGFLDEVDCPGSADGDIEVPPEWEGVGDPVEYLVASECGFGPDTRFDLSLISVSDAAPGEQPTWEIGLPDGTIGRLLPSGEIECPVASSAPDVPPPTPQPPSSDDPSCPDPLPPARISPEQAAACVMTRWANGDLDSASLFTTGGDVIEPLRDVEPDGPPEPFGCSPAEYPPPGDPNGDFGDPLNCVYQINDGLTANLYVDATPSAGGYVFAIAFAGVD